MNNYIFKFLLYLDIFIGSLAARDPDVTISSYCGLALRANPPSSGFWPKVARGLGRCLNAISNNHCNNAIAGDIARAQNAIKRLSASEKPQ